MTSTLSRLALAGCLATGAAGVAGAFVTPADYTLGFAPWWVTVLAAVAGAAAVTVRLSRRARLALGATATVLLLWSAAGVVLDGFRAFFAVTGIPAGDFATVDWFGFATRVLAAGSTAAVAALLARHARDTGTDAPVRPSRRPAVAAAVLIWPYPLLKLQWWCGGEVLRPRDEFSHSFPTGEVALAVLGTVLCLLLLSPRRFVPRRPLLLGAWTATLVLLTMGALSVFGTVSQLLGVTDGPVRFDPNTLTLVLSVYGGWLALGLLLAVATWRFQEATRPGRPDRTSG